MNPCTVDDCPNPSRNKRKAGPCDAHRQSRDYERDRAARTTLTLPPSVVGGLTLANGYRPPAVASKLDATGHAADALDPRRLPARVTGGRFGPIVSYPDRDPRTPVDGPAALDALKAEVWAADRIRERDALALPLVADHGWDGPVHNGRAHHNGRSGLSWADIYPSGPCPTFVALSGTCDPADDWHPVPAALAAAIGYASAGMLPDVDVSDLIEAARRYRAAAADPLHGLDEALPVAASPQAQRTGVNADDDDDDDPHAASLVAAVTDSAADIPDTDPLALFGPRDAVTGYGAGLLPLVDAAEADDADMNAAALKLAPALAESTLDPREQHALIVAEAVRTARDRVRAMWERREDPRRATVGYNTPLSEVPAADRARFQPKAIARTVAPEDRAHDDPDSPPRKGWGRVATMADASRALAQGTDVRPSVVVEPAAMASLYLAGGDRPGDLDARRAALAEREREGAEAWARIHPAPLPAPTLPGYALVLPPVRTTPIVASGLGPARVGVETWRDILRAMSEATRYLDEQRERAFARPSVWADPDSA